MAAAASALEQLERIIVIPRLVFALLLLLCGAAQAARPDPGAFAWQPHPGAPVPLDGHFTDSMGQKVTLRDLTGMPIVLALGYFQCPTLCGPVRSDVIAALEASRMVGGRDYRLLVMSIDGTETVKNAAAAKAADLAPSGGSGAGWHYLAGDAGPVAAAVGFPYRWDADLKQFAHPAGVVVLTPTGTVSTYLEGVGYTAAALKHAVDVAETGQVAATPSAILLLCFHFDAATGRYTLEIYKVLRLMAAATVVLVVGLMALLHFKRRNQRVT